LVELGYRTDIGRRLFNHTGDGRWPARTKQFRAAYTDDGPKIASGQQTLPSLKPINISLFSYQLLVGDAFGQFNGSKLLESGKITFIECANIP
jgi:hypothetical protein